MNKIELQCGRLMVEEQLEFFQAHPLKYSLRAFPCSVVAPDHCCIGNIRNILEALFLALGNIVAQKELNTLFSSALLVSDMPDEKNVFNVEKKHLSNTTFYNMSAIFSVALPACVQFVRFKNGHLRVRFRMCFAYAVF